MAIQLKQHDVLGNVTLAGNWNASTNNPTLANTDSVAVWMAYTCTTAGTVDFGDGDVVFAIGDLAVKGRDGKYFKWINSEVPQKTFYNDITFNETFDGTETGFTSVETDLPDGLVITSLVANGHTYAKSEYDAVPPSVTTGVLTITFDTAPAALQAGEILVLTADGEG